MKKIKTREKEKRKKGLVLWIFNLIEKSLPPGTLLAANCLFS